MKAMAEQDWQVFQLSELVGAIDRSTVDFHEFLRTPSMSCAIYHLPAGSKDMQTPHDEDELYLVVAGRGRLRVNGAEHPIVKDTLMYVRASCDHIFFDIKEDLTVLAFFGSAVNSALSSLSP